MRKSIGIVRFIERQDRIKFPEEMRSNFDIKHNDFLDIYTENKAVVVKKYSPGCLICGGVSGLMEFRDSLVCRNCAKEAGNFI